MDDQSAPASNAEEIALRTYIVGLERLPVEFVNVLHVNHDPTVFQLVFARNLVPLTLRPEERDAYIAKIMKEGVPAEAVCHLVVNPMQLRDMLELLQEQLKVYEERLGPIARFGRVSEPDEEPGDAH